MEFVSLQDVRVTDPFFLHIMRVIKDKMIPYQWETMNDRVPGAEKSYCIHNFRVAAGEISGTHGGYVFQDTDLAKWLEAVAYSLMIFPDDALEAQADEVIDLIGRAQQPDGYLNTYYTIVAPDRRFSNLMEGHELYTAGHMIEAAVAYHQATGKRVFLDIVCRFADHIAQHFGTAPGQCHGYPGHPEIELALYRLAAETGSEVYANLAQHFLNVRGQGENYFAMEMKKPGQRFIFGEMSSFHPEYWQSHAPVRDQRVAVGHAVRAMYLYSAMADMAMQTGDESMREACQALYQNVTTRQMYITGAIGASAHGEQFTSDYDLPNDTVYGETCASIGLMMFSVRMFLLTGASECFSIWEKALRNTVLAGMNQEGNRFFYVNPLETDPAAIEAHPMRQHVKPERQKWFGCACCPPNIARTVLSIGGNLYAQQGNDLFVLTHIPSEAAWRGGHVALRKEGEVFTLTLSGAPCTCYLRIPAGIDMSLPSDGNGFARIDHTGGEQTYTYAMCETPKLMMANPLIRADVGKAAIVEGSTVYCLESIDNGSQLGTVYIDPNTSFERLAMDFLPEGMHALKLRGYRLAQNAWQDTLYAPPRATFSPCELIAVPYSQWNNRGLGEMIVWLHLRER